MERVLYCSVFTSALLIAAFALLVGCGRKPEEAAIREQTFTSSVAAALSQPSQPGETMPEPPAGPGDELRRLRNLGCAALDSDDFKTAIDYFEKCCALSSNESSDLANLGMALYGDGQLEAAEEKLRQALAADPLNPIILYHLGLTCKKLSKLEDARAVFTRVTEIDPLDATSFYQLGSVQDQLGLLEDAERSFKKTIEIDPTHASAYYRLMAIYRKQRRRDEMKQAMEAFQSLRETTPESKRTEKQLERGRHSGAMWPKHGLVGPPLSTRPETKFVEVPLAVGDLLVGADLGDGRIDLADIDRDTFMDLVISGEARSATPAPPSILRNLGNLAFERLPVRWGAPEHYPVQDAQFGDFDRDGYRDLYVIGLGVTILQNVAGKDLVLATGVTGLPTAGLYQRALLVDEDHDGDLDLFLVPVPTRSSARPLAEIYRNNGSGQFADLTGTAGIPKSEGFVTGITILDADEDDDIDLLFATTRGLVLLANQRQSRFADFTAQAGLVGLGPVRACEAADINHDGLMDMVIARDDGCTVMRNDGPGRFTTPAESGELRQRTSGRRVRDLAVCDLNGDGNQDMVVACEPLAGSNSGLLVFFGNAQGEFTDVTGDVGLAGSAIDPSFCAAEDLDRDGDPELIVYDRMVGPRLFRNDTRGTQWISLILHGTKNNTEGIGTKVEAKVRNSYQKVLARRELVRFGIGGMHGVDVVRLQWPNGVLQGATHVVAGEILHATEREGEVGSCPYLYTWNGEKFVFVTDVIDTSPLGLLIGEKTLFPPRGYEVVRVTDEQLKPRQGRLLLRFTEELRELAYFDQVRLEAIDHPLGTEVYPDERFCMPPFPSGEPVTVRDARPPLAAWDANGNDILDLISQLDHRYPHPGERTHYAGFTHGQTLVLDLGRVQDERRVLLLLTGYLRWGYSSSLYAISQDARLAGKWPSFSVINKTGEWIEILPNYGFPAGKMKTMIVDLTGRFPTADCRVKIETNMEIYWDRVLVDTSQDPPPLTRTPVRLVAAHLRPRGYCDRRIIDGLALSIPLYGTFRPDPPYPLQVGFYTRYGDVKDLISRADDQLVVFNQGDELAIAFDSETLLPLPENRRRTYLVRIVGWVKDGDINTVTGATVGPMPRRDMKTYPYAYDKRASRLSPHQTRLVDRVLPPLEGPAVALR